MDYFMQQFDNSLMQLEEKDVKRARDMVRIKVNNETVERISYVPEFSLKDFVAV
jgi:hypothetical protein